ncbi:hydroxyphenylacetyl-CoA thioesterase PaaI [Saccharopolyspora hirsuta]|uniref:Hydroxyphenylacetyl-CoA thioesterase PaaI n=1 Tax=Saccharopolyspora hirsuta TaxID=1837 RepID=A0A5M7C4A5_SACHI|nr:hydroxyphenylacetyl-CoA thioesterase PaaI [Saccharopolyspora hirsuta]KAA5834384.1 hydroxyphenylacetyl-CoA thioesterase PaaI [Saccharopolyspora hirsuta]
MFDEDRASQALGIELLDVGSGTARARMTITATMVNGHGIAHGGYLFLLADTTFACACNSHGPTTVAARADVTFIRPARLGDQLVARAVERTRFGRSGIYDVSVHRGEELIAEFRGHSRTIGAAATSESEGARR